MTSFRLRARDERGFTIIEVLAAMVILLVGVLATAKIIDATSQANAATRQRDAATNIARELIEGAHSIPYERVSEPGVNAALQAIPGLEDAPGGGYVIRRNGVDYTITIDVCVMDDPKDGGGPRVATTTFCSNSAPPGTQDKNPEDYKRVTTTITWRLHNLQHRAVQTGIINNPGSASGPAIRLIVPRGYGAPYVVSDPSVTAVPIDITTSSKPAAINWLLDGTVKQPAPVQNGSTGLVWTATWNIGTTLTPQSGTLDGDYIISAEAFNQYGVSGPGRQETVILNRRKPFPPPQVAGGRSKFGTVEIEWTANSERDIIGYKVFRVSPGPLVQICPLTTETSCADPAPPDAPLVQYVVYAYDRDTAGVEREGDVSDTLDVTKDNQAPFPPTSLSGEAAADGTVTLRWSRPAPADPDTGDTIAFYRIYRDGQAIGDRYERWYDTRDLPEWQDTQTGGTKHSYSVTAVDTHFGESTFLGPVSP